MTEDISKRLKVGVGVIVLKDSKVLLGKRKNSHGGGTWNFPGGHMDYKESFFACARREVKEETGIVITNLRKGPYTNDYFEKEDKHYVTIFILADWKSGVPKVMEPDKCSQWNWFAWNQIPKPHFLPLKNLLKDSYSPFK